MAKIIRVIRMLNKGSYGVAIVQLDDGSEAECFIGGDVEVYFAHQKIKAFVKKRKQYQS